LFPPPLRTPKTLLALVSLTGVGLAAPAAAEERSTCDRLRAEARAEAALLYAPRIVVEGARVPGVARGAEIGDAADDGIQGRVALAVSPVDVMRGRATERIALAECVQDEVSLQIVEVLELGARYGELRATRAQLELLEARFGEIDALISEALDRFARQRATALEVDELRTRRARLRERAAELRHQIGMIEETRGGRAIDPDIDLAQLARAYRASVVAVDKRKSELRGLGAWRVDLRAGAAGADRVDWFAVVEVGYSLGQPWQKKAERRAAAARGRELDGDSRSLLVRLERLRSTMRRSADDLLVELRELDEELAVVRAERARVEGLDSDPARTLIARTTIELIDLEARRVAIVTLVDARRAFAGASP
jgi:hypothetical protein